MLALMKLLFIFISLICSASSLSTPEPTSERPPTDVPKSCNNSEGFEVKIPLHKQPKYEDNRVYSKYIRMNKSQTISVKFEDVNPNISFAIIEAHVHKNKVEMYKNYRLPNMTVKGSNIGLYSDVKEDRDLFYITNCNEHAGLTVLVSVHVYGPQDPIPGGCNLESPNPVAPYLTVKPFKMHYNSIFAAPPMAPYDPRCMKPESTNSNTVFYMIYLPEGDQTPKTYFMGLKKMLSLDSIQTYGRVVPKTAWQMRRSISSYAGIGVIYAAVVTTEKGYSVYVPTHSYNCNENPIFCEWNENVVALIATLYLFLTSANLCFFGHKYFLGELTAIAIADIFIIVLGLIPLSKSITSLWIFLGIAFAGFTFAVILTIIWMSFRVPVIGVLLPAINVGVLFASIVTHNLPDAFVFVHSNIHFWSQFMLLMLLAILVLVMMPYIGNLFCSSFLGAYGIVISIDLWLGSTMKYIIGNTLRRIFVDGFNNVVLLPPFTKNEGILTVMWVLLTMAGMLFQHWYHFDKPAFDYTDFDYVLEKFLSYMPRGNSNRTNEINERTPLLS